MVGKKMYLVEVAAVYAAGVLTGMAITVMIHKVADRAQPIMRRLLWIPNPAYDAGKHWFFQHPVLHMLLHQTFCRAKGRYVNMTWQEWVLTHRSDWKEWMK